MAGKFRHGEPEVVNYTPTNRHPDEGKVFGGGTFPSDSGTLTLQSFAVAASHDKRLGPPPKVLRGWKEILTALGMKSTERKNLRYQALKVPDCPIDFGSRGQQPQVIEADLLRWWHEQVVASVRESATRRRDKAATVEKKYQHGRSATVVPEINGHVRRSKKVKKGN